LKIRRDACWDLARIARQAILMAFSDQAHLADRFEQVRHVLNRRRGKTYRGFAQAVRRHSGDLFERIDGHLRAQMQALAGEHWRVEGFCAFAADGSQFDCPRTRANLKDLSYRGKDPLRPSLYMTGLSHLGLGLPWDWRVGPARESEKSHLLEMLGDLPNQAMLVMDAGFAGYELLRAIPQSGRHFLVRVGRCMHLLRDLDGRVERRKDRVYLWPQDRRGEPPLVLYLHKIGPKGKRVWLVSDLPLSAKQVERLYRARWGIELHHRTIKQTLERRKMLSRSPDLAQWELHWTLCGLWVLGLLGIQGLPRAHKKPRQLSAAEALRTVRAAVEGRLRGSLWSPLGRATLDTYRRRQSKKSRRWCHKKKDKPAGSPHVRRATPAEQQKAHNLYERLAAG
jgi:hypothetical protein